MDYEMDGLTVEQYFLLNEEQMNKIIESAETHDI